MKIGRVQIDSQVILTWLQLEGGHIWDVDFNRELQVMSFFIEHPEMPEKPDNEHAQTILLSFTTYQDNVGNKVAIRNPISEG